MTGAALTSIPGLELGECLGRGGEATIFALKSDPSTIAKLYHHHQPERAEKLALMIQRPPESIQEHGHTIIAWPTRRLFMPDGAGRLIGCLMPRVAGGIRAAELHNMKSRLVVSPHFHWRYLLRTAINLSLTVQKIHDAGYVIGDLNDQGVLVSDSALVSLVDCDSFQVRDLARQRVFRCPVGTGAYTPPELRGCTFAETDRSPAHDRFSLGILIYQLMMGCHPFQVKASDGEDALALEDAIARGWYPDADDTITSAPVAPPAEVLPSSTRALFRRAFVGPGAGRPTAAEWAADLWTADRGVTICPRNTNHHFAGHLANCPWCDRAVDLGGRDPFPSSDAIRAGDHVRRSVPKQYSFTSPRPRAHYDRRQRWRQGQGSAATPRVWKARGKS